MSYYPTNMYEVESGRYILRNKATGQTLDSNIGAAKHLSNAHKRVFANNVNDKAANHMWTIEKVLPGQYMICTVPNKYCDRMALDGNINVPQHRGTHPAPFLYQPTPEAPNHRWYLIPAPTGEPGLYIIVNAANGKALDGNVNGVDHYDKNHKTPFLWDRVDTAPNHQWFLQKIHYEPTINHITTAKSSTGAVLAGAGVGLVVAGPLGALVGAAIADTATRKK